MAARDRLFGRRRDGTLFPVEAGISKHSENGKTLYTAVVRDITERRRAEQAMRDYTGQLRQLSLRMFEAEENERRRLARELHDRIGQNVTALSLNLNMVRGELPEDCRHKVKTRLDDCESLLYQTAQLVRNVLVNLRPPGLDDLGLVAALKEHARQVAERTGVSAAVIGTEISPRLPPATEITLFRIVQEALNNIAKHARATEVTVTLEAGPDTVVLTVADNGCGFDTTARLVQPASSLGMVSMRERAESIGARLHIESAPGKGTRVIVEAPRANQNASSQPHAPGIEAAQDLGTWSSAKNNRKDEE
jgi:signal transduction histidine kinase